jgi:hypothetical protein
MSDRRDSRRGGLVGPAILIGLGVVFLLNNLGVLSWSIWETLLRLWPVLLVAAGLDLILGRRSIWGSLLALALTIAVLGGALWLSETGIASGQAPRSEEIAQPLGEADQAEVTIDPGIGSLHIEAASDSPNLVEGTLGLARREDLAKDFTVQGQRAIFVLRTEQASFGPSATGWAGQRLWDLQLSPRVSLRLKADLGLGEMDLDLSGLMLEDLDADLGLGQTVVTLPEEGRFEARIEGAIGQTVVVIPEGLAVRVRLDTGIAGRQLPDDYRCADDVCTSPNYGTADDRVDLQVSQAIGNLVIRH